MPVEYDTAPLPPTMIPREPVPDITWTDTFEAGFNLESDVMGDINALSNPIPQATEIDHVNPLH